MTEEAILCPEFEYRLHSTWVGFCACPPRVGLSFAQNSMCDDNDISLKIKLGKNNKKSSPQSSEQKA